MTELTADECRRRKAELSVHGRHVAIAVLVGFFGSLGILAVLNGETALMSGGPLVGHPSLIEGMVIILCIGILVALVYFQLRHPALSPAGCPYCKRQLSGWVLALSLRYRQCMYCNHELLDRR